MLFLPDRKYALLRYDTQALDEIITSTCLGKSKKKSLHLNCGNAKYDNWNNPITDVNFTQVWRNKKVRAEARTKLLDNKTNHAAGRRL